MVAGLKFLSKKGFNPQNLQNQKRVWEREQEKNTEERRIKEREDQLRRERDDEELARARGDSLKVNFMYKPPPGLEATTGKRTSGDKAVLGVSTAGSSSKAAITHAQPGDDEATAAFRAMLAAASAPATEDDSNSEKQDASGVIVRGTAPGAFGTVLQGSSYDKMAAGTKREEGQQTSSALEKMVGRRQQGNALTLDEQIERFPALANAPRQRGVQVGVNFKPLGTMIRNVRCMKCGVWGHSKGDRECQVSGWDPFSASSIAQPSSAAHSGRSANLDLDSKPSADEKMRRSKRWHESSSSDDDSDSEDYHSRRRTKKHRKRSYDSNSDDDSSSYRRRKKEKRRSKKKKKKHRKHEKEESSTRKQRHSDSKETK